jgi:hypothetical protein
LYFSKCSILIFLTTLDVCSQKSSGHKAVKFGRNTIYIGTTISQKIVQFCGGQVVTCVDLTWNDPNNIFFLNQSRYLIARPHKSGNRERGSRHWQLAEKVLKEHVILKGNGRIRVM